MRIPVRYHSALCPAARTDHGGLMELHLEHLRLLGHSDATIYGRWTFLRHLAREQIAGAAHPRYRQRPCSARGGLG